MRAALETIQQIEQYLLNEMSSAEKLAFESEISQNPTLKSQVELQQSLMAGIQRMGLKASAAKARSKYLLRKWSIRLGLLLLLVALSSFSYVYFNSTEDCVPCDNEIRYEGTDAVMDQNCCPQIEASPGPIETVPVSGFEIIEEECEDEIPVTSIKDSVFEGEKTDVENGANNLDNDLNEPIITDEILIPNVEFNGNGNSTITNASKDENVVDLVNVEPSFPGGEYALMQWLSANTIYPQSAIDNNLGGTVYVGFTVNERGKIINSNIKRSAHPILDQAALATIKKMPDWVPAEYNGEKIAVSYALPIKFVAGVY
ncbi:MAG: energy transducer TonB [Crocinitomicaceae bacterium]